MWREDIPSRLQDGLQLIIRLQRVQPTVKQTVILELRLRFARDLWRFTNVLWLIDWLIDWLIERDHLLVNNNAYHVTLGWTGLWTVWWNIGGQNSSWEKREVSKVSERQFEDHRLRELEMPKEELEGISTSSSDDVCGRSTVASILLICKCTFMA